MDNNKDSTKRVMDYNTYQEMAQSTCSDRFSTDNVDLYAMMQAMQQFIHAASILDKMKSSLFYESPVRQNKSLGEAVKITRNVNADVIHGILGVATESAEMVEALLKAFNTGSLDVVNMIEERGDLEWFEVLLDNGLNMDIEDVRFTNISKLNERFGVDAFSEEDFNVDPNRAKHTNRDTDKERFVLEDTQS